MASAGYPRPDALLGRGTVSARLLTHPALLLGGPRAILMQVAHPKVAAGVADHSGFSADPFGRLVRTLRTMDRIAFGSPARSARALEGLEARHRRIVGTTADGEEYSALDPALTLWVHATLVDTALTVDHRYLGLLGRADRARFYGESLLLAAAFGIPDDLVPPDLESFRTYMAGMAATVEVGGDARSIARHVLRPPLSGRAGGALGLLAAPLLEAVTADLLPGRLRHAYGLRRVPSLVPGLALPGPIGVATDGAGALGMGLAAAVSRLFAARLAGLPVSRLAL
jgi:uncharacterized protein (DUF2236 family)